MPIVLIGFISGIYAIINANYSYDFWSNYRKYKKNNTTPKVFYKIEENIHKKNKIILYIALPFFALFAFALFFGEPHTVDDLAILSVNVFGLLFLNLSAIINLYTIAIQEKVNKYILDPSSKKEIDPKTKLKRKIIGISTVCVLVVVVIASSVFSFLNDSDSSSDTSDSHPHNSYSGPEAYGLPPDEVTDPPIDTPVTPPPKSYVNSDKPEKSTDTPVTPPPKSSPPKEYHNSYDDGYNSVWDDEDYDSDRYKNDWDYATGVDDALDELGEDY